MVVTAMLFTKETILNNNQNGFSLIELLIALAILALSMLAAASMQFGSIRNNASGNMATQANMLAKAKMEELKSATDLTTLDGSQCFPSLSGTIVPFAHTVRFVCSSVVLNG